MGRPGQALRIKTASNHELHDTQSQNQTRRTREPCPGYAGTILFLPYKWCPAFLLLLVCELQIGGDPFSPHGCGLGGRGAPLTTHVTTGS